MADSSNKRTGRPPRASIDVVRTIFWYWWVLETSQWSEYKLEVIFDEKDRRALGLHKGSRWNKYKFGKASPSRRLLEEVDQKFPGTLRCYDHPLWTLANEERIAATDLRSLMEQMPREMVAGLVDVDSPAGSPFWVREEAQSDELIKSMLALQSKPKLGYYAVMAGLLLLIHDSTNRQKEMQHFESHVAMAYAATNLPRNVSSETYAWRMESLVLGRWLQTEYKNKRLRDVVDQMRGLKSGPQPPWGPRQSSLALGSVNVRKEANDQRDKMGYWAIHELAKTAKELGLVERWRTG